MNIMVKRESVDDGLMHWWIWQNVEIDPISIVLYETFQLQS